jgi:hypothetical protein
VVVQRRDALRTLAVLAGVPALAGRTPGDRLAGAAIGAGRLSALTPAEDATVVALAERIIPATDTPGATAARVNRFIDVLLSDWFTDEERGEFLAGLGEVDARARAAYGRAFAGGTADEQDRVVAELDDEAHHVAGAERSAVGRFFGRFKALTLYGYYNSEVGMTQELRYVIIPNHYAPCAPLEPA